MEIIRVRKGEVRDNTDRIFVNHAERRGRFMWTGSVLVGDSREWGGAAADFSSVADAEADAVAWADSLGAPAVVIQELD